MRKILLAIGVIALMVACNPANQKINRATLEQDVQKIKEADPDLDSLKVKAITYLVQLSKDRDFYIKKAKENPNFSAEKYIVDDERFDKRTGDLFQKVQAYTYQDLFDEMDKIHAIHEKHDLIQKPLKQEIDSLCAVFQKMIDQHEITTRSLSDSLNKLVDIKIVSISEERRMLRDMIQFKVLLTNKSDKPVEAVGFDIEVNDKLGNSLPTLHCKAMTTFTKSTVNYWIYDEFENREMYKAYKNFNLSEITYKVIINKVNLNGTLIGNTEETLSMGDFSFEGTNHHYTRPNTPYGSCDYLNEKSKYAQKNKELDEQREKEIRNGNFPIALSIIDLDLFDFTK